MAKKAVSTTGQPPTTAEYRYIGPAYKSAVWLCGRRFVPHTMNQEQIARAMAELPALDRYFARPLDAEAITVYTQEEPPTPPPAEDEAAPEEV